MTGLRECEGFEVVGPDGRVGVVERILFEDGDRDVAPAVLVVRVGLFGRRILDASDVLAVDPRRRRITVPGSPRPVVREALVEMKEHRDGRVPECTSRGTAP